MAEVGAARRAGAERGAAQRGVGVASALLDASEDAMPPLPRGRVEGRSIVLVH